jgi:hypothetical protein
MTLSSTESSNVNPVARGIQNRSVKCGHLSNSSSDKRSVNIDNMENKLGIFIFAFINDIGLNTTKMIKMSNLAKNNKKAKTTQGQGL